MRVLNVLRKCDPSAWGGTETAMQRMLEALRLQGVSPVIYRPRLDPEPSEDPLRRSGFQVERFNAFVPVLGMPAERKRQLVAVGGNLMSFDLISALARDRSASIIHAHTLGRLGGIALTVAKRRRVPFIVTIHGGVMDLPENVKRSFNAKAETGWEWGRLLGWVFQSHRLFVDADAIITCNEKEAALLRKAHPDKRIIVQPHGVNLEQYSRDQRGAARAGFPRIEGRRVLLALGRIDPIKNQAWLLERLPAVVAREPRALLVLAGACTDEAYGHLVARQVHELGLSEHVLMTGGLPQSDPRLIGLLQQAESLVLPSLSETFGLVILEAWAAGKPVICSRTSGATALVTEGENGWLFDLEEPAGFLRAVDQAFSNPELCARMAELGAEKVRSEFSMNQVAGKLRQTYEAVIERRHALRHH